MEKGVILLTGYEPFFDMERNPSLEACRTIEGMVYNGYSVVVEEIPMDYTRIREIIEGHLDHYKPAACVCTGVLSRGAAISVERVAINVGSAEGPSNFGYTQLDQSLNPDGPVAYWTKLPFRALLSELKAAKIPAVLSNSAGTYGCNQIFYHLMDYLVRNSVDIPAGFIHIPRLPEHVLGENTPSMSLETSGRAMEVVVEYLSGTLS
jgi:pyroglutamyl-peptidase